MDMTHREGKVTLISPLSYLSTATAEQTTLQLHSGFNISSSTSSPDIKWLKPKEAELEQGILLDISIPGTPKQVTWHHKGDYLATLSSNGKLA